MKPPFEHVITSSIWSPACRDDPSKYLYVHMYGLNTPTFGRLKLIVNRVVEQPGIPDPGYEKFRIIFHDRIRGRAREFRNSGSMEPPRNRRVRLLLSAYMAEELSISVSTQNRLSTKNFC